MFKKLFSWWKEDILLKQALEQTDIALEKANDMFSFAMKVLLDGAGGKKHIYDMDKEINKLQIDMRKKILEHLSISPEQDVTASLVLITVVVDIERIGDFSKNIVELWHAYTPAMEETEYLHEIRSIREEIEELIIQTREAFKEADTRKAKKTMEEYTRICHRCDDSVKALFYDKDLKTSEAIFYTLLSRYLKRISSHARNISSSVVNPFYRLGYKPE
ncbi:PhoU domain-containing protein [candidate division WOR-3 bacterium]|nr:PhoU domain-containing protein [candidate division WOR-3 bacterium]